VAGDPCLRASSAGAFAAERDAVFGAGLVTAMGLGFLSMRQEDVARKIAIEAAVEPDAGLTECYDRLFERYRSVDAALADENSR